MPNYIKNKLEVYASSAEEALEIKKFLVRGYTIKQREKTNEVITLNSFAKMPTELFATEESTEKERALDLISNLLNLKQNECRFKKVEINEKERELCLKGLKVLENIINFGYSNWYDFALSEWETKWDCMDSFIKDTNMNSFELWFETANTSPIRVITEMLSKEFPNADFNFYYADEYIYSDNIGYCEVIKGEMTNQVEYDSESEEALEVFYDLWKPTNIVRNENGKLEIIEEEQNEYEFGKD